MWFASRRTQGTRRVVAIAWPVYADLPALLAVGTLLGKSF